MTFGGGGSRDPQGHPKVPPSPPYGISRGGGGAQMGSPLASMRSHDFGGGGGLSRDPQSHPKVPPPGNGWFGVGGGGWGQNWGPHPHPRDHVTFFGGEGDVT